MMTWKKKHLLSLLAVVAVGALGSTVGSQQPNPKEEDQQTVNAKAQQIAPAAKINFKKDLGLSYNSLSTLGPRIDAARLNHDPVSLAHAANELSIAEKVSGKKAELTSAALINEAAKLAQLRRQVSELQEVQEIARQNAADDDLIAEMKKNLADFDTQAKDETAALRSNQPPPDSSRTVIVHNNTTQNFDIWVNGFFKMRVGPGESKWFVVEHKWNPTVVEAFGDTFGHIYEQKWGPVHLWGKFKTYTVNLN